MKKLLIAILLITIILCFGGCDKNSTTTDYNNSTDTNYDTKNIDTTESDSNNVTTNKDDNSTTTNNEIDKEQPGEEYFLEDELTNGFYIKSGDKFYEVNAYRGNTSPFVGDKYYSGGMSEHKIAFSTTYSAEPIGDNFDILFIENLSVRKNVLKEGDQFVKVSSTGEPPTSEYFLKANVPYYAVPEDDYYFSYNEEGQLTDGPPVYNQILEINGNRNLDEYSYTVISGFVGLDDIYIEGKLGETITYSIHGGTQGMNTEELLLNSQLVVTPHAIKENKIELIYNPPENGYAILNTSMLEKGYYRIITSENNLTNYIIEIQ